MMIEKLTPLFDLDGTLIREERGSKRVAAKKIRIAKWVMRKLVDNDERTLEGLGELGELVSQDQTEF